MLFVVLYGLEAEKYGDAYFQEEVVPKLCEVLRGSDCLYPGKGGQAD